MSPNHVTCEFDF